MITQPRTDQGSNGMSFVNCRLTRSSPGVLNRLFARPLGYPFSSVAFIRCLIDTHITDWDTRLLIGRGGVKNPELRWWEHGISNLTATGIPEPAYQWRMNGANLVGETGGTLDLPHAGLSDAAAYSVVASNAAGVVCGQPHPHSFGDLPRDS